MRHIEQIIAKNNCKKQKLCYNEIADLSGQNIPTFIYNLYGGNMQEKLENIRKNIEPALKQQEIIITDITYHNEGNYNFLTIELDKINGIDLDEIVEATNIINPIIDKLDFIDDSYILDVISKERG